MIPVRSLWRSVVSLSLACVIYQPFAALAQAPDKSNTLVVEAEQFQFPAGWTPTLSPNCSGGKYLANSGMDRDALTVVELPQAGKYHLWTRSRCYNSDKPGTRRYRLIVNSQPAASESGLSSSDGWVWEEVGTADLPKGQNVIGLRDTAKFFGRCDAILLTTTDANPAALDAKALQPWVVAPADIQGRPSTPPSIAKLAKQEGTRQEVARIESDQVKLVFLQGLDTDGKPIILRETQLNTAGRWTTLFPPDGSESLYLIASPNGRINVADIMPSWPDTRSAVTFEVQGKTYQAPTNAADPYTAGDASLMVPRSCRSLNSTTVEVIYQSASGEKVIGQWQLQPGRRDVHFTASYEVTQPGDYSLAFCPNTPTDPKALKSVLLPPAFRFQRIHPTGFMITSSATSHPLSLVEREVNQQRYTSLVAADPAALPFQWSQNNNAAYGFSLRNAQGEIQPAIFQPVLGLPSSYFKPGQTLHSSCYVLAQGGQWGEALEYASQTIFQVTDYRQPWQCSLTDAALNIIDLMKDANASGWDARLKGFYQIESKSTVSQVSPLAVVDAALLTYDESLYVSRALPTIEYTLSRPIAHFAVSEPPSKPVYVAEPNTHLQVPSKFFGTAYWQGLNELLGHANPWIAEMALQGDGEVRWNRSYSAMPHWSELLGAYRLSPKPALLEQIRQEADKFLAKEIYAPKTGDIDLLGFCNVQAYPYWWDLLDLYELTHDPKYLAAAEQGGFHTVSSLWSLPQPPDGNIRVHPGNTFNEHPLMWWKNDVKSRLGFPRQPGDMPQHEVLAWLVANSGLGVEQLTTYYDRQGTRGMQNILMSCWAPHLLRLYSYTGREIFLDYARNTIIGRFGNYPGYYVSGYTDRYLSPRYPYEGPDVTDIYYHHVPAQLAFTLDFIVSQAQSRSHNAITFPWCKQQGYVWFTNRIFGGQPGSIFDDRAVELRLRRLPVSPESITYLTGRSKNHCWVVLMNEAPTNVQAQLQLDLQSMDIQPDSPYRILGADGALLGSGKVTPTLTQAVPAKGLVALDFPANTDPTIGRILPPVTAGHFKQTINPTWGDLHAFRIRSPFGKDSLYIVLTGKPKPGAKATLLLQGDNAPAIAPVADYPYEFSVYPWPMDRDILFKLDLADADGQPSTTNMVTLVGTR